ncbi:MAG: hypothetical protein RIC55_03610 [Pirellulaceae bacterium]
MHGQSKRVAVLLMALAVCTSTVSTGCQSLRIPAIDPSGRRLFLPPPNYTTLASASPATQQFGILPTPAWSPPPFPPPCPDSPPPPTYPTYIEPDCGSPQSVPVVVAPQVLQAPRQDRLTLTPKRILSPVGSEVVLVSGLCGHKGYYLKREPIEWTINRPGVGQFVEVASERSGWRWLWDTKPGKVGADLAIGRTSVLPETITQGNSDVTDDVRVVSGQTWVSVTSPVEGTTRVTAFSPNVEDWTLRKQTATIYWIDAEWTLPAPAVVPAGQTHLLNTKLTRSDGVTPLEGYIVRYEVTGGPPASFAPSGESAVDVISDPQGNAAVEIAQAPGQGGTTQVRIRIVRPQCGDEPSLEIGSGWTSLTWSAPQLALSMSGPASAALDSTAAYQITVTNPGDLPARDVVVSDVLPAGLTLIGSDPPAAPMGDRLEWRLGDLPGQMSQTITLNCRVSGRGDVRHCASARTADGLTADDCVTTRVSAPSLSVNMTGPETAEVGDQVEFRIEITNLAPETLRNVTLIDSFDAGLEQTDGEPSPMYLPLGDLEAGGVRRKAVRFHVRSAGQLRHILEASADNSEKVVATALLDATQPAAPVVPDRPSVSISLTGSGQVQVGRDAAFEIVVANNGNVPLTGVQVVYRYPDSFTPSGTLPTVAAHQPGALIWQVERLEVGQRTTFQVGCTTTRAGAAVGRAEVTTQQDVSNAAQQTTNVTPATAPPGAENPPPDGGAGQENVPVTGNLSISIADQADPVRVGQRVTYLIVVKNDRNVSDKNVAVTISFPAGLDFKSLRGPIQPVRSSSREVDLAPIAELRAGESVTLRVEAEPQRAGRFVVRSSVTSLRSGDGLSSEADTTVNAP